MARRSDFAQKLLDDLRLRKQRVAASESATQRSGQSNQLPIDAYAYSKQKDRGSKHTKSNEITSFRSNRSHRSTTTGEVSSQIVPYGHGREVGDLSMALAFAFENGVKLRRTTDSSFTGSVMSFLNQIRRGSMDFGKMERQSNLDRQLVPTGYSTLSPVQINQIAKGAQKLNQILSFCSNGLNIGRNSIEFANELLKGAMDLEDSLRVLVELQKTSEFMVTSQKKNRITLLDEEEEDGDVDVDKMIKSSEQRQLARPVFSFDKPSRYSQNPGEVRNTILMQRTVTLAYSKDGRSKNKEKNDMNTRKLTSHKRSASYSSASAQSNTEKGRIPNVIAKLMGLDNLPEKMESKYTPQKDSGSTQKIEGKTGRGRTKTFDHMNKQAESLVPPKKQKLSEVISTPATKGKELMLGADRNLIIQKADGIKGMGGLEKANTRIDKKHNSAAQMNLIRESQKDVQVKEKRQDHTNSREQRGSGKGKTIDPTLNHALEQAHERSQVKFSMHDVKESNGSILQSRNRYENKDSPNNQNKSRSHPGTQESYMPLKYMSQEEKARGEEQVQQSAKLMLQVRAQRRSETQSKHDVTNSLKKQLLLNQGRSFKHNPSENVVAVKAEFLNSQNDQLCRDEASTNLHEKMKEKNNRKAGKISSFKDQKSEPVKGWSRLVTVMDEKSVDKLANKKVKNTIKHKIDMPGKTDIVLTRRNGTMFHATKEVKDESPILQERRQNRYDILNVSKEAEAHNINCSESVAIIKPLNVRNQTHEEAELPLTLSSPEPVAPVHSDSYQEVKLVEINDLHDQITLAAQQKELKSCEIETNTINGIHESRMDVYHHSQLDQNISSEEIQEPLTESENHLKRILVTSQLFLNTAEALFRLNISLNILQGGGLDNHDAGSKLLLDCGYEVMKRKGIWQELKVHPCSKMSISTVKIESLDDLVRQLNKDMEKLKFYGRNRSSEADVEDYLPKMLEYDIYNKDPDINCMWDLGWNDETLAFVEKYDLIRDVEKHIINGVLDEITGELLHVLTHWKM